MKLVTVCSCLLAGSTALLWTPRQDKRAAKPWMQAESREVGSVRLSVDDTAVLHRLPNPYHGTNLVSHWNPVGDSPEMVRAYSQLGFKLLRFPGGVTAHFYDWKQPKRISNVNLSPADAYRVAQSSGGEMIFQTNAANDRPSGGGKKGAKKQGAAPKPTGLHYDSCGEHAAAWARECLRSGIKVAYWEIGNEPEMDAPKELKADPDATYRWYNRKFEEHARAIKAADPKAKLMGPASTNIYYWWRLGNLERFLKAHGNRYGTGLVDAVSVHYYPEAWKLDWPEARAVPSKWPGAMKFIRETIRKYDTRPLPVYVTEWNFSGGTNNATAGKLSNALGCADIVGLFRQTGVAGHTHFCLQRIRNNWGMLASASDSREPSAPSPTYFAMAIAARLEGDVLRVKSDKDKKTVVSSYGARAADGSLRIMAINKTLAKQTVTLDFALFKPSGRPMDLYTLEGLKGGLGSAKVRYNGVEDPHPERDSLPAPRRITAAGPCRIELPPLSMALAVFPR